MTALVGPIRDGIIRFGLFGSAGAVAYTPPGDTTDPRYDACTDHHVACDCREAEISEERREHAAFRDTVQAAFDAALDGHPTYDNWRDGATPCQCSGCQIARAIHVIPKGSTS